MGLNKMNPLVVSTLPHFYVLLYTLPNPYTLIVLHSCFLSVAWHSETPHTRLVGIIDYALAGAWQAADTWYFWDTPYFWTVICCNSIVFLCNQAVDKLKISYDIWHSVWHLVSAAKAIYVASLFAKI